MVVVRGFQAPIGGRNLLSMFNFSQMNHNVFCVIDDAMKRYRAMNMKRKKTSTEGGLLLLERNKESERAAFKVAGKLF